MSYVQHDSIVATITNGVANLKTEYASRPVATTSAAAHPDIEGHMDELRAEVRRTVSSIRVSLLRAAVASAVNEALQETVGQIRKGMNSRKRISRGKSRRLVGSSQLRPHSVDRRSSEPKYGSIGTGAPASRAMRFKGKAKADNLTTSPDSLSAADVTSDESDASGYERRWYRCYLNSSDTRTTTMFGTITSSSKTYGFCPEDAEPDSLFDEDHIEWNTSFRIHPAQWVLRLGFSFGFDFAMSKSQQGWKHHLETYRAVPDDSKIFEYCRTGNLVGVRALLDEGSASVWDRDSNLYTPLLVSCLRHRLKCLSC